MCRPSWVLLSLTVTTVRSGPPIRLHVRRHEVFVDSYHQLQHRKKSEMMNKIIVRSTATRMEHASSLVRSNSLERRESMLVALFGSGLAF